MNSDELWNQIQKLIDGIYLSDLITEDSNNAYGISVKDSRDAEVLRLPIRKLNHIWTFISKTTKLSVEFMQYLNTKLSDLKDEEKSKVPTLSETLSAKINGLHLKVDVPNSLTKMLLEVINTEDTSNLSDVPGKGNHPLSVVVQILELDPKYIKADCLGLLQPNQLIPAADSKWYNKVSQFAVKLNFTETVFEGEVSDAQALVAMVITLSCYPEQWHKTFFWDAWLTVTIQLCLLANVQPDKIIFPCLWMKHIFDAERMVGPEHIQYLLFGKDPFSDTHAYGLDTLCKASGTAFHAIGNDNPSIQGMKMKYGLDCDGDNPMKYCHDGLLMVNLIRCICEDDGSLGKNSCRGAWITYSLKLIHYFSRKNKPVIVLTTDSSVLTTDSSVLPEIYIPAVCSGDLVRAPDPSMPKDIESDQQQNINRVRQYLSGYNRPNNHKHRSHAQKPSSVCAIL